MNPQVKMQFPALLSTPIVSDGAALLDALPSATAPSGPRCLIRADNDLDAVRCFLDRYADSPNTYLSYEKEADRLILWLVLVAHKGLRELDAEDVTALFSFYRNPPQDWISNSRAARNTEEWRPFRGPLSESAITHARRVLRSLFDFLLTARYIDGNPVALIRSPRGSSNRTSTGARRSQLIPASIEFCNRAIEDIIEENPPRGLRAKFIFNFYLMTAARRMELAETSVGDIVQERGRWWMQTLGKGAKDASLPVPPKVLEALSDLRTHHGLPPLPSPGEQLPLFARIDDPTTPISGNMVYRELKLVFGAARLKAEEARSLAAAEQLANASTHWLRHTAIGRVVGSTKSLQLGKALGRHVSVNTTAEYATFEQDQLHDQIVDAVETEFSSTAPAAEPEQKTS